MLLDSGFDWVHVYLAMPIFGSRLYDICVENGYIENSSIAGFRRDEIGHPRARH